MSEPGEVRPEVMPASPCGSFCDVEFAGAPLCGTMRPQRDVDDVLQSFDEHLAHEA